MRVLVAAQRLGAVELAAAVIAGENSRRRRRQRRRGDDGVLGLVRYLGIGIGGHHAECEVERDGFVEGGRGVSTFFLGVERGEFLDRCVGGDLAAHFGFVLGFDIETRGHHN